MKPLSKSLLVLLLSLTTAAAISQTSGKPRIFTKFPESVDVSPLQFDKAFLSKEGEKITIAFSDDLIITGTVLTNVKKYDNLYSLTMQSKEYANAIFHLSKQINIDKSVSYVGRIISTDASDAFELGRNASGNYKMNKIIIADIRQICSQ